MSGQDNVVPLMRPSDPLAYAPGVTPFDRSDPVHIQAWNTLFALGWSERRFAQRERDGRQQGEAE